MIKANELRIGNLVIAHHNKPHKITASCIVAQSQFDIASIKGYSPIPLTEEILLKCAFIQQPSPFSGVFINGLISLVGDYNESYNVVGYKLVLRTGAGTIEARVKNIHQLQNLYFSLIGEELNISNLTDL